MDIDSHFSATRANGASSLRRAAFAPKGLPDHDEIAGSWSDLREALQNVPDSRPEAVERARNLIADPDYPPPHMQEMLAGHLAVLLTADIDPLPT